MGCTTVPRWITDSGNSSDRGWRPMATSAPGGGRPPQASCQADGGSLACLWFSSGIAACQKYSPYGVVMSLFLPGPFLCSSAARTGQPPRLLGRRDLACPWQSSRVLLRQHSQARLGKPPHARGAGLRRPALANHANSCRTCQPGGSGCCLDSSLLAPTWPVSWSRFCALLDLRVLPC